MLGNTCTNRLRLVHRFPAPAMLVLGKALEPLETESGKIMALITRENSKGIFCELGNRRFPVSQKLVCNFLGLCNNYPRLTDYTI